MCTWTEWLNIQQKAWDPLLLQHLHQETFLQPEKQRKKSPTRIPIYLWEEKKFVSSFMTKTASGLLFPKFQLKSSSPSGIDTNVWLYSCNSLPQLMRPCWLVHTADTQSAVTCKWSEGALQGLENWSVLSLQSSWFKTFCAFAFVSEDIIQWVDEGCRIVQ